MRTAREYPTIGSHGVPVAMFVRRIVHYLQILLILVIVAQESIVPFAPGKVLTAPTSMI